MDSTAQEARIACKFTGLFQGKKTKKRVVLLRMEPVKANLEIQFLKSAKKSASNSNLQYEIETSLVICKKDIREMEAKPLKQICEIQLSNLYSPVQQKTVGPIIEFQFEKIDYTRVVTFLQQNHFPVKIQTSTSPSNGLFNSRNSTNPFASYQDKTTEEGQPDANVKWKLEPEPQQWKEAQIMEWLSLLTDRDGITFKKKYAQEFEGIQGRDLLKMKVETVVDVEQLLNISDRHDANVVLMELKEMKRFPHYFLERKKVAYKFKFMDQRVYKLFTTHLSKMNMDSEEYLGDKNRLREYMLMEWNPELITEWIIEERKEIETEDTTTTTTSSSLDSQISIPSGLFQEGVDAQQIVIDRRRVKVKLVITEIDTTNRNLRRVLSPIVSSLPDAISPSFGLFHLALVIGKWYFEWSNINLCIPRQIYSDKAIIVTDLSVPVGKLEDSRESVVDKLATVITYWNANMSYHNIGNRKNNTGNCQDFVEDCLEALGIRLHFEGGLKKHLERLRKFGTADMIFELDEELQAKLGMDQKVIRFTTHKELDDFVNLILKHDVTFATTHVHDYALLKSFDRAFWLRFIKYQRKKISKMEYQEHHCPFDDPRNTISFQE